MKITAVLLLAACLTASASGHSQQVTLNEKDAPLEKVFKAIKQQTGYSFFFNEALLKKANLVTIQVSNRSLTEVLNICFVNQPLTYSIVGNTVVIEEKLKANNPDPVIANEPPPPLRITGTVYSDSTKIPLEGANIALKNKRSGTKTNAAGEFTIDAEIGDIIVISYVGYRDFEVSVTNNSLVINVALKLAIGESEEVFINTGYERLKQNELTGSVFHLNRDQIERSVSTDILSRMNGISNSLQFGLTKSALNTNGIQLRTLSTINSSSSPLIILDNFPFEGDINLINPNDIESVTILRDASATSIWDSRSSNGVIVLTTKNGKYGQRTGVSINSNISISEKPDLFYSKVLGSSDYIDVEKYLYENAYYTGRINDPGRLALSPVVEILLKQQAGQITPAQADAQISSLRTIDGRNQIGDIFLHKSIKQQYSVSIGGGGQDYRYYISLGFDKNLNSNVRDEFDRLSLTINNTFQLLKRKLEISPRIMYFQNTNHRNSALPNLDYPYARFVDENGNSLSIAKYRQGYIDTAGSGKLLDWSYRPVDELRFGNNKSITTQYQAGLDIRCKVFTGFETEVKYRYDRGTIETSNLQSI